MAGVAAVACAAVLWALGATVATRLFALGVEPVELVEVRIVIAALGLAPFALLASRPTRLAWSGARVVAYGVMIAVANLTFFLALDRLPVAVAIVLQNLAPGFVIVWGLLAARRAPPARVVAIVVAAAVGVALVVDFPGRSGGTGVGVVLGLLTAVAVAAFSLLGQDASRAYGAIGATFRAFAVASVLSLAYQLPRGTPAALRESHLLGAIAFVGVVGTLLPFLLFSWGVGRARAEAASIAISLEPVAGAVVAWAWLGQALTPLQVLGGGFVIAAVAALMLDPRHARDPGAVRPVAHARSASDGRRAAPRRV